MACLWPGDFIESAGGYGKTPANATGPACFRPRSPSGAAGGARGGRVIATDWLQVIFSPTFPLRLAHMVLAAYLTTAMVVGAAVLGELWWPRNRDPANPGQSN